VGFHAFIHTFSHLQIHFNLPLFAAFALKQYLIYHFVCRASASKKSIRSGMSPPLPAHLVMFYGLQSVAVEVLEYSWAPKLLLFIPVSFLFEILFDFFHYWAHRASHAIPWLSHYHHIHHSHVHLEPISAFQHHPIDLFLTNVIPFVLTAHILPVSATTCLGILWFKALVEIGGHCGKILKTSSFPQCIWLPRFLGIALYSQHHAEHHRCGHRMFGKRFLLWDRVFGTSYP
jgi:sterol desaturase/sphingolipid hydroxylase (fatty acid hydroxylase superfamily)